MTEDKRQLMQNLIDRLNQASDAYYNGRDELMTDYEWDAMFDQLKSLETETGEILAGSPTNKVSEDDVAGQKEDHEFPALSLAKTKKPADLVRWAEMRPIWISWKLDGLTLVVTYDAGKLTKVVTRGNGHTGTNITHLASAIGGIPVQISYPGHVVIRGEAVISYQDFERFNMENDAEYANPRNLASGSLTLKDPLEVQARHIQWIPFTLVHTDEEIPSWGQRMDWMAHLGFHPVEHELIAEPSPEHIQDAIDRWTLRVTGQNTKAPSAATHNTHSDPPEGREPARHHPSADNPYPVDGLVITYDDTAYASTGSVTGHHATRAGYAFKWKDESADTELDHIEWSCAASTISPVAVFKPVELEGTTVKRASLCNISECRRLGMGGQGTTLSVIKANKIIPKVIRVIHPVGTFSVPRTCPVCGSATEIRVSEASGTQTLHCTNSACPAKQLKKFARFVSKGGMDVDGISEQTLARFINLGWVSQYADIYRLREHAAAMARLEGFGERSAGNMLRAIESSRNVTAQRFLFALTIPLCGADVCNRLLSRYPLEELIREARQTAREDRFAVISGIGPEKSASFVRWFHDADNQRAVDALLQEVTVSHPSTRPTGARCQGLTFVVTGDVHRYRNRSQLKSYIESQGGRVTGSVSKSTSCLINNDLTSPSGKNRKAQALGIPILSEDEFIARYGAEAPSPSPAAEGSLF